MSALDEFRAAKDAFFRDDPDSPLLPRQRAAFTGLSYYPERPELAFELEPQPLEQPQRVQMQTSSGASANYERWARVRFEIDGRPVDLTVYREPHERALFLPFQDANAGGETYGGGRYLEPQQGDHGRLLLDFNYAYNPYCAYSDHWSCPLPPAENHLPVAIRAGERSFRDWHGA
ncbi:MAG: DUF1684 domain-containing protein [Dehalococcoidia bacterium]|nr:DUF1684 domain-containing protein [Dehalococcoidia bacterium]